MWWTFGVPYGIMISTYDECRRYILRHFPGGFMEDLTYY